MRRITKKLVGKRVDIAIENIEAQLRREYDPTNKFGRGLGREGYVGGYLQALMDVDALLRGMLPDRNRWWEQRDDDE